MARADVLATPRLGSRSSIVSIPTWWIEPLVAVPLVGLAVALRLVNLGVYSGLFDEGIRVEQLFLMSNGYRPFRDIYAAQGPLLLDLLHPWFVLFGQDLAAARLAVGVYSLVGLAAAYWVARLVGGPVAAVAALLLLVVSPLYLEGSRIALAEVPAMAPAILAVGTAILYARSGSRGLLVATGLLLATSLLIKPITLAAGVPVGLAVLSRGRAAFKDGLILGLLVAATMLAVVFMVGLAGVLEQIVAYRMDSVKRSDWSIWKNRLALARALSFEPPALLSMALLAGVLALARRRLAEALLVAWAVASVGLLLFYSPLHGKHAVVMLPPYAILAGVGLALAVRLARSSRRPLVRVGVAVALVGLAGWYAASAPAVMAQSGQLLKVTADTDVDPALEQYADAVSVIRSLTTPRDFVVTDHPYLPFLAGRLVPPELVDTSKSRIESRSLRANDAVTIAAGYEPRLIVLWTDRLRPLKIFKEWVEDNYRLVKVYNRRQDLDRGIYVRKDANLDVVRATLAVAALAPRGDEFAGGLRLAGASLDRAEIRSGEGVALSLHWEAARDLDADYHVIVALMGPDGQAWDQQQESLSGGSVGTNEWAAGHWLFQNTFVRPTADAPRGEYAVVVSAYDSRGKRMAPLADGRTELTVGTLIVR